MENQNHNYDHMLDDFLDNEDEKYSQKIRYLIILINHQPAMLPHIHGMCYYSGNTVVPPVE
ncbi:MAG: hypothetical protein GX854_02380 [Clostridiales bacterium]|jgi:hypothetical protein|nr:hypothetical protein [Clostridiales bacterium]